MNIETKEELMDLLMSLSTRLDSIEESSSKKDDEDTNIVEDDNINEDITEDEIEKLLGL